ncbi:MAG: tetratricopeptide repeat protein [Phycisphaerae bacterium]
MEGIEVPRKCLNPRPVAAQGNQHYEVLREMGDCYAALGRSDKAADCYRRAAELAPGLAGPHVGLGVLAIQSGRLDDAVKALRTACELDPTCAEGYGGLAMIHQQRGDYHSAFDMYLKCLELDTDNLVALLGLFQTSCQMGTFGKITRYLETYLDRHPGDTSVLFCLATLYARDGQHDKARDAVLRVLALEPGKSEAADMLRELDTRRSTEAVNT